MILASTKEEKIPVQMIGLFNRKNSSLFYYDIMIFELEL